MDGDGPVVAALKAVLPRLDRCAKRLLGQPPLWYSDVRVEIAKELGDLADALRAALPKET